MAYTYYDFADDFRGVINNLPVMILLQYKNNLMKFQVNPEKIKLDRGSESTKAKVVSIGEVGTPSTPSLARINISSFFWQDRNMIPSSAYINWLEKWQKSKEPAKLIVTRLNYSMYVTCESFWHETRAGEENDIYYSLDLQEYKQFGAKRVNIPDKKSFFSKVFEGAKKVGDYVTAPLLFEIPRPNRLRNLKIVKSPYKTKDGDTLLSITKKCINTTTGWKDLYNLNKEKLGNMVASGVIPTGTELNLPEGWKGLKI